MGTLGKAGSPSLVSGAPPALQPRWAGNHRNYCAQTELQLLPSRLQGTGQSHSLVLTGFAVPSWIFHVPAGDQLNHDGLGTFLSAPAGRAQLWAVSCQGELAHLPLLLSVCLFVPCMYPLKVFSSWNKVRRVIFSYAPLLDFFTSFTANP